MITLDEPSATDRGNFERDGYLIVPSLLDTGLIDSLHAAFEDLFNGRFQTGIKPDEVNWQFESGDPALTRQICNGWKANDTIASVVLHPKLGQSIARLTGWSGVRIMIDNVLWKPPGAKSLGYHQDSAFLDWFTPSDLVTCWIALDDTQADGGTMELVQGSHLWQKRGQPSEPAGEFHAPDNYLLPMQTAAQCQGVVPEITAVEVPAGGGSFHHGWCWHGSGQNNTQNPRRSLVLHAMCAEVSYVPENFNRGIGPIYSRYRKLESNELDENHFPVIWSSNGYRTAGLPV